MKKWNKDVYISLSLCSFFLFLLKKGGRVRVLIVFFFFLNELIFNEKKKILKYFPPKNCSFKSSCRVVNFHMNIHSNI